ncbi:hypothetical protein [Micropruina sonneratiae]|uniref:hypothetical protein n=1 Tax=Micropruina sonneratiae TaxID=2986940 RepID=UPI002227F9F8|nr:hypothetical protein [Micropruina sp. KQZ13P-5]MCW3157866.1 hypothetical protein [Micropruina sp. KQZ13P-5]
MSAMLVDETVQTAAVNPATTRPRWRHVPRQRGPIARPQHPATSGSRPLGPAAPLIRRATPAAAEPVVEVAPGWRLTRRGLAVVMAVFLSVVAAGVVTLVAGFLAVSNEPVQAPAAAVAVQVP